MKRTGDSRSASSHADLISRLAACAVGLVAVALIAAVPWAAPPYYATICPGRYGGHLQGIAVDGDGAIFWSFTVRLVKTDAQGKIVGQVDAPNHAGDLTYHAGKLYCAVNLGEFNQEPGKADSWVWVYDAASLEVLAKHRVPEVVHGAGGMAHRDGRFYVIGGLPEGYEENYVYEYDEKFRFVNRHVLPSGYTLLGIQTACFADGYFWFGCYGNKLLKADASLKLVGKYDFDCSLGVAAIGDGRMLVGRKLGDDALRGQVLEFVQDEQSGMKPAAGN